jgi:hypothetical protein
MSYKAIKAFGFASVLAFSLSNLVLAQEAFNYSEDINQNTQQLIFVAAATPTTANQNKVSINYNELAGHFSALVKSSQISARDDSLANATKISENIANTPFYVNGEAIDGAKAIAIIAALNDSEFVNNAKQVSAFVGADNFATNLVTQPQNVRNLSGFNSAQNKAASSIALALDKIDAASNKIAQSSYDLQKQSWATIASDKRLHLDALARAKSANQSVFTPIHSTDLGTDQISTIAVNDRIIAAAALIAIGKENEAQNLIRLGTGASCADDTYLNLRMCISATKYPYEHAYCLANHAYRDVRQCVIKALK